MRDLNPGPGCRGSIGALRGVGLVRIACSERGTSVSDDEKLPWPEKYADPFQPAREPDGDWVFNACMDERPTRWRYATGYRTGAELLFRYLKMTGEREHNDVVVYPLVFCWRHYLELVLKESVQNARGLTGTEGKADLSEHRLMPLWEELRPHLPEFGAPPLDIKVVGRTIQYLSRFDPGSFAFRYPTTTNGDSTQSDIPTHINLRHLDKVMQGIANWLDAGISEMAERAQHEAEMQAECEANMHAWYGSEGDNDDEGYGY